MPWRLPRSQLSDPQAHAAGGLSGQPLLEPCLNPPLDDVRRLSFVRVGTRAKNRIDQAMTCQPTCRTLLAGLDLPVTSCFRRHYPSPHDSG